MVCWATPRRAQVFSSVAVAPPVEVARGDGLPVLPGVASTGVPPGFGDVVPSGVDGRGVGLLDAAGDDALGDGCALPPVLDAQADAARRRTSASAARFLGVGEGELMRTIEKIPERPRVTGGSLPRRALRRPCRARSGRGRSS